MGDAATTTRLGWRRLIPRLRARATPAEAAASEAGDAPVSLSPLAYRTFSRKLAPSMTALGGLAAVAGGLGAWVRATQVVSEGLPEEQVAVEMGHASDVGIAIAILGGIATVSSILWFTRRLLPKLFPFLSALATCVLAAWQLPALGRRAGELADAARAGEIDFVSFHAGLGWGAWLLVVACVLLVIGASAGALREVDVRKGVAG